MGSKKRNPHGSKKADPANAYRPVDALVAPEWHRQPLEGDSAYLAFKLWLDLPLEERTIAAVASLRGITRTNVSNWSARWRWSDRLRCRQNADASVEDAERANAARAMVKRHAASARAQLAVHDRLAAEVQKRLSSGKFSLKGVTDAELLRLLQLSATPTATLAGVERVARGLPATGVAVITGDDAGKSLGGGSYLDLVEAVAKADLDAATAAAMGAAAPAKTTTAPAAEEGEGSDEDAAALAMLTDEVATA